MDDSIEIFSRLLDLQTRGQSFCLATVIVSNVQNVAVGRKLIVFPDGTTEGSVGSARTDASLQSLALQSLKEKKKRTVVLEDSMQAFLDIFTADLQLLVCGAGHIAMPLVRFAREVGFRVTVLDDRSDFAHSSRFPGCQVMTEDFTTALRKMPLGPSTFVVVITRGHEHDTECLQAILPKETAYVGLIGSRRRIHFVLEMLSRKGISHQRLDEVFTPIGLPLGSESPEEIALAIMAELVCIRRKGVRLARAMRAASGGEK